MKIIKADIWKELGIHAVLWGAYFVFEVFAYVNYEYTFAELNYLFFLALPAKVIFIYPTIFWSIPRFFQKKKYVAFICITLALLLIGTVMHRQMVHNLFLRDYRPDVFNSTNPWTMNPLLRSGYFILTVSAVFIAFSMVRLSYRQQQINSSLLTANVSAELKSLKEQVKPHFLFNTLNNLYGLIRQNPEKASEVVLRLSQLMNYILYSSNYQKVILSKEVRYLEDYIELEKIRYGNDLQIIFHPEIGNGNFMIAPLLLQPFVENAFKHGLSRQLNDTWLKIDLVVEGREMTFKVVNSKPKIVNGTPANRGIGIDNVRKRLALIYPDSHRLKIIDEEQTFLISLTIINEEEKNHRAIL